MESVSTLMDGELAEVEAAREITRLKADASCRESWEAYHLIGDVMRGGASGTIGASKFCARFSERIALEPTVLAPRTRVTPKVQSYALRAAASLAAIAVVGWAALNAFKADIPAFTGQIAKAPAEQPKLAVLQPPAVPSRPAKVGYAATEHVHEYLLAHQGISPITAIQGVTPYIRTVSSAGD